MIWLPFFRPVSAMVVEEVLVTTEESEALTMRSRWGDRRVFWDSRLWSCAFVEAVAISMVGGSDRIGLPGMISSCSVL
jgi:hypothetical protein